MAIISEIILKEFNNHIECAHLIGLLDNAIQAYRTYDCLQSEFREPMLKVSSFNKILIAINNILQNKERFKGDIDLILALKIYKDKLVSKNISETQKDEIIKKIKNRISKYKIVSQ